MVACAELCVCVSVCAVCSCQAQTLQRGKYLIYMYFLEEKCNISSAGKQVWRKIPRSQMELTGTYSTTTQKGKQTQIKKFCSFAVPIVIAGAL